MGQDSEGTFNATCMRQEVKEEEKVLAVLLTDQSRLPLTAADFNGFQQARHVSEPPAPNQSRQG